MATNSFDYCGSFDSFGGKKLPQLMKGLGEGMKEFKNASKDLNNDNKEEK